MLNHTRSQQLFQEGFVAEGCHGGGTSALSPLIGGRFFNVTRSSERRMTQDDLVATNDSDGPFKRFMMF